VSAATGRRLSGRYEVGRVFADSGGMGILYLARDARTRGNEVLVKAVRYDGSEGAKNFRYTAAEAVAHVERLRKILEWEKKILIRMKGERLNNIPNLNDFFHDESLTLERSYRGKLGEYALPPDLLRREPYLVLEKIDGRTLESMVGTPELRARAEEICLKVAKEMCTILLRLHRPFELQGKTACFLYQDMKPGNILVGGDDCLTLIDFGGVTLRLGDRTTEPTAGVLTAGYAAPEGEGEGATRIDARYDLYTLGATLWHCLTGIDPRTLGGISPVLDPRALDRIPLSPRTRALVARALERDPARRFPSAAEMRKEVLACLQEGGLED
jgi:serine/threonine protein kinase